MKDSDDLNEQHILTLVNRVLEEVKNRRVERIIVQPTEEGGYTILLSDYMHWATYYDELTEWCELYDDKQVNMSGMVVTVNNEETLTLFLLRWM